MSAFDFAGLIDSAPTGPEAVIVPAIGRTIDEIATLKDLVVGTRREDVPARMAEALREIAPNAASLTAASIASHLLSRVAPLARDVEQLRRAMRLICALIDRWPVPTDRRRTIIERDANEAASRRAMLAAVAQGLPLPMRDDPLEDATRARFVLGSARIEVSLQHRTAPVPFDGLVVLADGQGAGLEPL